MNEMNKLHEMLLSARIPHTFMSMGPGYGADSLQIRIYSDNTYTHELDDAVFHYYSHGYKLGLLETYSLGGCDGFETAEQVFEGWVEMYSKAQPKSHCDCSIIGAGGEVWEGSAPSWD